MRRTNPVLLENRTHEPMQFLFRFQIRNRRPSCDLSMYLLQIERSSQPAGLAFTQEKDHASSLTKHSGHQFDSLFDFAHHPDHRSWMNWPGR